ncbi:hypothetical protein ABQD64_13615 [Vagococcus fluvialis]|uniref:hypothetical protein n=1 Tax=Vagococcus fluvialis TaxID=2738 RepID=UPI0032E40F47
MSWSDQNAGAFQEQSDINVLKQNYANAELAYQALNRDYKATLTELKKTQQMITQLNQKTVDTDQAFEQLKQDLVEKMNRINQLTSLNQHQFDQLSQHKQGLDREVSIIVNIYYCSYYGHTDLIGFSTRYNLIYVNQF